MRKPEFVYVTLIKTTPEKLWHALTNTAFTESYWFGCSLTSDWKVGSRMHMDRAGKVVNEGFVLESDPPRRLSYSWLSVFDAEMIKERPSRVTFVLEPSDGAVKLTVTHEDVYSLAGTDSSHIALREGEEVPLTDALYATQMASANDGANLLAEYVGEGTIADGVAKMNARVEELGLAHTHFANPHGISDEDHYTSCYDMAQILRWALEQPGFEQVFTRNEMYTMDPTNIQPVTRYFSQQDKMRIGSSRYYISSILGSKLGYTNTARYSYACLAEQNGVRLICVTMQSELSTDKYNDMRTLLDYAFSTFTGYTDLPAQGITAPLSVVGGGGSLGTVTVSDPGVRLLLANGLTADDVEVTLELPESYVLGSDPEVYAVYTVHGGEKQESTSVRVDAEISGLPELLENSTGQELEAAKAVKPQSHAFWLLGISLGSTAAAALVTFLVVRFITWRKKRRRTRTEQGQTRRGK